MIHAFANLNRNVEMLAQLGPWLLLILHVRIFPAVIDKTFSSEAATRGVL